MHMRTKKWAKPELAVCPYFTDEPETKRGRWRAQFEREQPLYLELGCGKGVSTAAMVKDNPTINYVAVDITCNVLGDTRRNIEKAFDGEPDVYKRQGAACARPAGGIRAAVRLENGSDV